MAKKNNRQSGGAIGKAILYNRNVLYFIFFLSLGYLFYILSTYDYYTFSIFVIIGFLTSFFSKNMVVILALAMSVSFIFKYGTNIRPEGFEEGVDMPPMPPGMPSMPPSTGGMPSMPPGMPSMPPSTDGMPPSMPPTMPPSTAGMPPSTAGMPTMPPSTAGMPMPTMPPSIGGMPTMPPSSSLPASIQNMQLISPN